MEVPDAYDTLTYTVLGVLGGVAILLIVLAVAALCIAGHLGKEGRGVSAFAHWAWAHDMAMGIRPVHDPRLVASTNQIAPNFQNHAVISGVRYHCCENQNICVRTVIATLLWHNQINYNKIETPCT